MDNKYKCAKYFGLLGASLFSFSVLQNQATTTYADTGDAIRSSVVDDGSQGKKSSGGSEGSSQKISNSDSQVTDANSDGTGKTNASDTSKIQSPVTKSTSIKDTSGSDGSNDTANTGPNGAGRISSIGVNDGQVETEDATTPVVAASKNLVVIKKNDSSVYLDNQLKISTDSTANIKNGETYQLKINTLVNNNVINGDIGKAFGRASIDDIEKSSNSVGTMYVAPVIMTPADQAGPVIVRYFSAQGILRKKITLKGKLGESYTTSIKTPKYESGYTVDQTRWPRNAQGIFSKDTTYVDYYYAAPIDSWKAYQDQTQINTVISGNNKLMDLNVYYPNGDKVSLTITRENKIQVHTISPNGYSTKTIILTIGDERDITDSDGSTHWIKVLGNGNVYLWYMYDYGQITDVVNGQGQLLKHKFIKMNKVHVNTISQVTSPREQRYRNNEALNQSPNSRKLKVNLSESNSRPSKFNFHIYSDSLISHETNSAQVLPQTGDHRRGLWIILGTVMSWISLFGMAILRLKKGRKSDE